MFACRSESRVRSKSYLWIEAATFILILAAALILHPLAAGAASRTSTKAVADSEGISVRVIEDGKVAKVRKLRSVRDKVVGEDEDVDKPDVPEPPDAPEPPDLPGSHENDLVRFGQDIEIPADKVIEGSVVAIGGSITVYGRVKGDCTAVGGSVSIKDKGVVEGDAVSVGGQTSAEDSATVSGSNVSVGGWPHGGHGREFLPLLGAFGFGAIAGIIANVIKLLLTLLFAWLCLMLIRERMEHAVSRMEGDFVKPFLWGLVGWMGMLVAIPAIAVVGAIAIVILAITIIGIPIAILLAIAMVFALIGAVLGIIITAFVGFLNGAWYVGRRMLLRRSPGTIVTPLKAIGAGLILIIGIGILGEILGFIGLVFLMPIGIALGIASKILGFVFTTAGIGAMILTRFSKGPAFATATPAPAAPAGAGWYAPPPPAAGPATPGPSAAGGPSPSPQTPPGAPEGGTSDAP